MADAVGLDPAPGTPRWTRLAEHLRPRRGLLVLDNCEHVLDAAADVAERLLEACRDLRVLATSRAPLGVDGEEVLRLGGLELPAGHDEGELRASAAVALFLDRARAAGAAADAVSQLDAVAEICRRLDGSPLAIELAAGRTRSLAPAEIAARLDERFSLLAVSGRRAAARHRTLGAAIDWSYELLDEPQRRGLRAPVGLRRGATLDAARDVCAGDGVRREEVADALDQLVAHSLVQPGAGGRATVYAMLETLREYAAARLLARGEHGAARDRHADHYRARAQAMIDAALAWRSALPFIDEFDDVRAALRWCRDTDATPSAPSRSSSRSGAWPPPSTPRTSPSRPRRRSRAGPTSARCGCMRWAPRRPRGCSPATARRRTPTRTTRVALEERGGRRPALLGRRTLAHLARCTRTRPTPPRRSPRTSPRGPATPVRRRWPASATASPSSSCRRRAITIGRRAGRADARRGRPARRALHGVLVALRQRRGAPGGRRRPRRAAGSRRRSPSGARWATTTWCASACARSASPRCSRGDHDEAAERLLAALAHDEARTDAASQWTTLTTLALLLAERGRPRAAARAAGRVGGLARVPDPRGLGRAPGSGSPARWAPQEQAAAAERGGRLDLEAAKALARAELAQADDAQRGAGGGPQGAGAAPDADDDLVAAGRRAGAPPWARGRRG